MVFKLAKKIFVRKRKRSYLGDDFAIVAESYRKAAEQGHAASQYQLGTLYQEGRGVRQDFLVAVSWYQKAAEQGHAASQYQLGSLYQEGRGVRQDKLQAKEWFGKACDNGNQNGCDAYRILNE